MSEVGNVEEATRIAEQFVGKYYLLHRLEKVGRQDDIWVVEFDVSILGPKEIIRVELEQKTGSIIGYTKL